MSRRGRGLVCRWRQGIPGTSEVWSWGVRVCPTSGSWLGSWRSGQMAQDRQSSHHDTSLMTKDTMGFSPPSAN